MRGLKNPVLGSILGYLLLGIALAMAVPPFAGPDESDHYGRVQGIGSGELIGKRVPPATPQVTPAQTAFLSQTVRQVLIPARRSAVGYDCLKTSATISAACQDPVLANPLPQQQADPVGAYQPLPYLAPAAVVSLGGSAPAALRWERLASLAVVLGLLASALVCAAGSVWLMVGVLLSVTPGMLLLGASLGGSGMEIAGSIASASGLLALGLGRAPRVALTVSVVGAVALVGARALGPLWLVAVSAVCIPFAFDRLRKLDRRLVIALFLFVVVAVVCQQLWERAFGVDAKLDLVPNPESLKAGVRGLPDTLSEAVGGVGFLEYLLPWPIVVAWTAAVVFLVAIAARAAGWIERGLLICVVLGAIAIAPLLFAVAIVFTGFGVQGRHVMPFAVLVPLLAGAVATRHLVSTRGADWIGRLVAVVQFVAFLLVARRYAVGTDGPIWFFGHGWTPPLGWVPWLILAALGSALIATSIDARSGRSGSSDPSSSGTRRSQATAQP
jgi:hypothetical protein